MQFYEIKPNYPIFLVCKVKIVNLCLYKLGNMKNKNLWIALTVIAIGVGTYFVVRKAKFKSQDKQKDSRNIQLVSTTK